MPVQVEARPIGRTDTVIESIRFTSEHRIKGLFRFNVGIRLQPKQTRQRSLAVEIDRQNAIAPQGHVLREMNGSRRLSRAALEIGDGNNL